MRRTFAGILLMSLLASPVLAVEEPSSEYVIQKGDTLWGLSERFFNDPWYWPDLWAKNPAIPNPHLIFPGQKVKIFPDRIEIEPAPAAAAKKTPEVPSVEKAPEETVKVKTFSVPRGAGFVESNGGKESGTIIGTYNDRVVVAENDVVYTDIGSRNGAKSGDLFSIYRRGEAVSHPATNAVLGYRVVDLGALKLTEVLEQSSKAVIISANKEIQAGDTLRPYREPKQNVALKRGESDLRGFLIASSTGTETMGEGDAVYIDLGTRNGVEPGNMLYVVKEIEPSIREASKIRLPLQVQGALVVVESGKSISTAVIVKSAEPMYRGDRILLSR